MPTFMHCYDDDRFLFEKPRADLHVPVEQLSDLDIPVGWRDLGVLELPVTDPDAAMEMVHYFTGGQND